MWKPSRSACTTACNLLGTLYALCGFIGSGKTTYARQLVEQQRCFRLNTDELMARLYGQDSPAELFEERHYKIERLQLDYAARLLKIGTNVVLDRGLWSRAARDEIRQFAADIGAPTKFYYIRVPDAVMRKRAVNRPLDSETLVITSETWDKLRVKFEPPADDEDFIIIDNTADR